MSHIDKGVAGGGGNTPINLFVWEFKATSFTAQVGHGYIIEALGPITMTLPATVGVLGAVTAIFSSTGVLVNIVPSGGGSIALGDTTSNLGIQATDFGDGTFLRALNLTPAAWFTMGNQGNIVPL